ncbi:hypothetical protein [Clostridium taeniosporum]|uniref:Uncharacterized protein n=1 Tax=Clostridium taeniosporum TaxID=394958 RepID=A0A1D7XL12_9CLOT|nr:hypothetical protein [Clostridium taeniosporum]AOR24032.1 hypothetical protein BGI42_09945 [Clostridium taeniosporum]
MAVIYNEHISDEGYYNQYKNYKKKKKEDNYIYDLKVKKEKIYKSKYIDLNLEVTCNEKYLDIQMDELKYIRIFGTLKDSKGNIVKNKKITLFKSKLVNYKTEYIPVCDMITDERGLYEALIEEDYTNTHYIVKVLNG